MEPARRKRGDVNLTGYTVEALLAVSGTTCGLLLERPAAAAAMGLVMSG